ncbi:MAG: DNA gyrase subunit A [Fimbriimonadia bacterium]|jgi:DNA gyrase subunit A
MAEAGQGIGTVQIEEELKRSYLDYAMSVIIARALPDARDGLKPVQRRILYAMRELNLTPDRQHTKSAKVTGEVAGNYHPHGGEVIYPTIARLAQPFNMRYPLVDGQGNFGSVDGDPPAAMRYTEVRLTPYAMECLEDIDRETVDWRPNYLQDREEPVVLPGKFPNLLCNGGAGIAVGMATNIPPHNLTEVINALLHRIRKPDCSLDEIMEHLPGPDFPTAGLILGVKGIRQAYETGRGSIIMQARHQIEPMEHGKAAIVITELPYQVNKRTLLENIDLLVKSKKLDGITALNDYSNRLGMRVVIELRRDVNPNTILNFLLKHTALRSSFGVNMLSLVDDVPRCLPLLTILDHTIAHRREVIRRRTEYELFRAQDRAHLLEGFQIAIRFLDEIIALIRGSETAEAARREMVVRFGMSVVQANYILSIQLRQLARLEQQRIDDEYRALLRTIGSLLHILSDPERLTQIMIDEWTALRDKYGDARRTKITPHEPGEVRDEDLIPEEETIVTITRDNYIKRVPIDSYRTQRRGGKGVIAQTTKEEDTLSHLFQVSTHHYILFFTDRGRVYRLKAYEIPESSRQAKGSPIINYIAIASDEKVTATLSVREFRADGYLVMVSRRGEIKRTQLSQFQNLRANGLIAFDLEENDALVWVHHTHGSSDLTLISRNGMCIRFPEEEVPSRGRAAGGVRGMRLAPDDEVVSSLIVDNNATLLVVSENGYGKRTAFDEYRGQHRGGKGIITMKCTDKTGRVVGAEAVTDKDVVLLMSEQAKAIRVRVREIRVIGRNTQGVRVHTLREGDRLANLAKVIEEPQNIEDEQGTLNL